MCHLSSGNTSNFQSVDQHVMSIMQPQNILLSIALRFDFFHLGLCDSLYQRGQVLSCTPSSKDWICTLLVSSDLNRAIMFLPTCFFTAYEKPLIDATLIDVASCTLPLLVEMAPLHLLIDVDCPDRVGPVAAADCCCLS